MELYVDTSAAAKLILAEPESEALARFLDAAVDSGDGLFSSYLLETELRRLAVRFKFSQAMVTEVLDRFDLLVPGRATFRDAGLLAGRNLRSLDALHIAAALQLNVGSMLTYDLRQAEAARAVGLRVSAPA